MISEKWIVVLVGPPSAPGSGVNILPWPEPPLKSSRASALARSHIAHLARAHLYFIIFSHQLEIWTAGEKKIHQPENQRFSSSEHVSATAK